MFIVALCFERIDQNNHPVAMSVPNAQILLLLSQSPRRDLLKKWQILRQGVYKINLDSSLGVRKL